MFDIVSISMGLKTWAATSKVLQRLKKASPKTRHQSGHQDRNAVTSTIDLGWRYETRPRWVLDKLPLAVGILDDPTAVNQQLACPLFTKLPAELRELVWSYALTAYEDPHAYYPINMSYARPGQAAPLRVAVQLLLTCRAIYLETFITPFHVNPMIVFDTYPGFMPPLDPLQCTTSNLRLCDKLRDWQFANIRSVDLSVQQYMLEGGSLERVSRRSGNKGRHEGHQTVGFTVAGYASFIPRGDSKPSREFPAPGSNGGLVRSILRGKEITHLTLRMSRMDWWAWTSSPQAGISNPHEALRLEPMINVTERHETSTAMLEGYEARKAGQEPNFNLDEFEKQGRWGMQFAEFWPDLKTFELVLETYVAKESQLDSVINCAKLWTFPLGDGKQLVWNGAEESTVRWHGAKEYGYEKNLAMSWPRHQPDTDERQGQDASTLQWHPDGRDGQQFVIKSLIFTRRQTSEATTSSDK
ncbi:hypothetical protein F4777DRAFT_69319 [Nemania sp. FL0916]|nr:hypothetical protein F4777DRAFT_69319 [Nemania sp. FL0916]